MMDEPVKKINKILNVDFSHYPEVRCLAQALYTTSTNTYTDMVWKNFTQLTTKEKRLVFDYYDKRNVFAFWYKDNRPKGTKGSPVYKNCPSTSESDTESTTDEPDRSPVLATSTHTMSLRPRAR